MWIRIWNPQCLGHVWNRFHWSWEPQWSRPDRGALGMQHFDGRDWCWPGLCTYLLALDFQSQTRNRPQLDSGIGTARLRGADAYHYKNHWIETNYLQVARSTDWVLLNSKEQQTVFFRMNFVSMWCSEGGQDLQEQNEAKCLRTLVFSGILCPSEGAFLCGIIRIIHAVFMLRRDCFKWKSIVLQTRPSGSPDPENKLMCVTSLERRQNRTHKNSSGIPRCFPNLVFQNVMFRGSSGSARADCSKVLENAGVFRHSLSFWRGFPLWRLLHYSCHFNAFQRTISTPLWSG